VRTSTVTEELNGTFTVSGSGSPAWPEPRRDSTQ
jgi:hypothetical protein